MSSSVPPPPAHEPAGETPLTSSAEPDTTTPGAQGTPPTGQNSPLAGLLGIPAVAGRIWSGRLTQGLALAQSLPRFGWVTLALAVVVVPFVLTFLLGRVGSTLMNNIGRSMGLGSYGGYQQQYLGLSAGEFFQVYLLLLIPVAIIILLRVVSVWAAFAWAGSPRSFSTAANVLSAAYTGHLFVMVLVFLLALLPGNTTAVIAMMALYVLGAVAEFGATLATYVGINREGQFGTRSPFLPHVVCTALWAVLSGIVLYLFADILQGMM